MAGHRAIPAWDQCMILPLRNVASRTISVLLAGIAALSACGPALAERPVEAVTLAITTVTPPAWMVRNGAKTPMAPGMALQPGEIFHTGPGGRVEASLGGLGSLHLGANARLFVSDADTATLRVLAGAFRVSTRAPRSGDGWRIRLPGLSATVTDTELWGRVTESRQHLILRRGSALVRTDGGTVLDMRRPDDRLDVGPGDASAAIAQATPAERGRLLEETGSAPGTGMLTTGGRWRVTVLETRSEWKALAAYDRLRDAGYPAVISPTDGRNEPAYGVVLRGMATRAEARALAARVTTLPGFDASRPTISTAR